jgi:hypothetical protein
MKTPNHSPALAPRWRSGIGLLLALGVLGGSVELHQEHRLPELDAAAVAMGGCHPGLATHLEPPAAPAKPHCPACLLRLKLAGSHLPDVRHADMEPVAESGLAEPVRPQSSTPRSPCLSRGPPPAFA